MRTLFPYGVIWGPPLRLDAYVNLRAGSGPDSWKEKISGRGTRVPVALRHYPKIRQVQHLSDGAQLEGLLDLLFAEFPRQGPTVHA